jgi:hypothetical protein
MRKLIVALALIALPTAVAAQTRTSNPALNDPDRLFLGFIEDAAIVSQQWWEGQIQFVDGLYENDAVDITAIYGVAAFQPVSDLEVGGRVGFGDSDIDGFDGDGSGATDLDLWAKYYIGANNEDTDWSLGGVVTVPTGDDTAGLGSDAFAVSGFSAVRHRLDKATVTGHLGLQMNGDGRAAGSTVDLDGQFAVQLGAGVIAPFTDDLSLVGELVYRGERFDGFDDDARLLGGVNWKVGNRGIVRAAVAVGLMDAAPDAQLIFGYAANF